MPSGFPFNISIPPPAEDGPRRRYVVLAISMGGTAFDRGKAVEVEWVIRLRRSNAAAGGAEYEMHVVQAPGRPAPYEVNAVVEIDPLLLEGTSPHD